MLNYAELYIPKGETPREKDQPYTCCRFIGDVAFIGIMIIGLPILGVVYALDFCFYTHGHIRPCFKSCMG